MKNSTSELGLGKRIGFVLETIHYGFSTNLWLGVASKAAESTGSFFILPGGKLTKKDDSENLRNKIYSLANSKNFDGLISWASSIGGRVSIQELDNFHKSFSDLPFVTIGHKISNHPYVEFDAYSGMKELVLHFIKNHNAKKIAFIRGPEYHSSAEDRFRAYKDAMKENGLNTKSSEKLISSPCDWHHAENAAKELLEERELVPGKDFDVLIASSDLMALSVVDYFSKSGYKVPDDYLVGGFNNTVEGRVFSPQFSTVHIPQKELGLESVNMLSQVLNEKQVADRYLDAYPIIRESCGCNSIKNLGSFSDSKIKINTKEQFKAEFVKAFRLESRPEAVQNRLNLLFDSLFSNSKTEFFSLLDGLLQDYFEKDGELSNIFSVMKIFRNAKCFSDDASEKIIRTIGVMIPKILERVAAGKRFKITQENAIVNDLKNKLLSVHTRIELFNVLKEYLPKLRINTISLVLHENDKISKYLGGFNLLSGLDDFRFNGKLFDSDSIVPDEYSSDFDRGVFIVQPLFMENRYYGYFVANYSGCDGSIYEDLRVCISSALQSIFLFEEIEAAKRKAEQAEYEKTEFFANVGSDLCDPLKDLSAKVTQIERNVNEGLLDADILGEQLIFLKSQIEAQLEKTETLVDLTRSQVDDLPMDKRLFSINQILPANAVAGIKDEMPLLFGDIDRLKKAMSTIFEMTVEIPEITIKADGLHLKFNSSKIDWRKPEVLLAEKIILLQYGDILKSETESEIVFSWPNLSGLPPSKFESSEVQVYSLSNSEMEMFGEKLTSVFNSDFDFDEISDNSAFVWKYDEATIDELVKVYSLRRNNRFFRASIICYSSSLIGHNFIEVLEQKVKTQKTNSVLFVGATHTRYGTWATDTNSVFIPSMDSFENILNEITPSLIVFEHINEADIIKIRKNHKTVLVPILVLPDEILSEKEVNLLCSHPKIILCNRGAAESEQFNVRVQEILSGDEILPPHTGALVKKAILYLNQNASQQIVRWKLADTVNVSEDYLTRIFHKEIGLSLWEYLNRYRIYLATKMLLETNATIYEIAENSGFQDQAYFCRVFKKIYGVPPGKIRTKK